MRWPAVWGYQPVMIETRLGPQTECCDQAEWKRVPRRARASRCGVCATGLPKQPRASARSWSGVNSSRLGRPIPADGRAHSFGQESRVSAAVATAFFAACAKSTIDIEVSTTRA